MTIMYVCLCNPFTDKDVQNHLKEHGQKARPNEVYKACSGGEKMNCGTCSKTLNDMVRTHNNNLTVEAISDSINQTIPKKEPV